MNRRIIFLICLLLTAAATLCLSACEQVKPVTTAAPATTTTSPVAAHIHELSYHPTVPATCITEGNYKHWSCEGCGKNFSDQYATEELTNVTVPPTNRHSYINGKCTVCGHTIQILEFREVEDGTYAVSKLSTTSFVTEIVIPSTYLDAPVTAIDEKAFEQLQSLVSITIPASVKSIGSRAFSGCQDLETVTFEENSQLTVIGEYAFFDCCDLADFIIPASVTEIGAEAFCNCDKLLSITIPPRVTSIGDLAFYNCKGLVSITIPEGVTSIGQYAFACPKLVEVYNLSSFDISKDSPSYGYIAERALNIYTSLDEASKLWTDEDGFLFYENGTECYLLGYTGRETKISLPDTCHGKSYGIYDYAWYRQRSPVSVTIPEEVTSIGKWAFCGCGNLAEVTFAPNSRLTSIGPYAFASCSSLVNIAIPEGVTSIQERTFYGCRSLQTMTFGENSQITSIGINAFEECAILVQIVIPEGVTSIKEFAFYNCTSLQTVVFCENSQLTNIGHNAFSDCKNLVRIVIPDRVTDIGKNAFYGCTSLTIYCRTDSPPNGWKSSWNPSKCPVVWGYTGD